ncbi:MAG: TRAP transporter substrate-binding protein [Treponema sp.]|nr:TRAP transporter substrate-binding protein [Treponema sp.]
MKRLSSIAFAITFSAAIFVSCTDKNSATIKKHPVTLRLSENHGAGYPTALADEEFARLVEEQTEGRVVIEVREGGALAQNEGDAIEGLKNGDLAFTRVSASSVAPYVDKINAIQFPYIYKSSEHMWNVLNGSIGQEILSEIERTSKDLVGLCYYDAGSRNFYVTKPVNSVSDMKGLRIRVQNSQLMLDMCEALGAKGVVGLNMTEIRGAIMNDIIDGAENNFPSYESNGDYSIAPYFILDSHTRVPEILIASKKVLNRLDPKDVEIIKSVAKQTQEFEIQKWKEKEAASEQISRQNGCKVIQLTPKAYEEFQKAMAPVYEKHGQKYMSIIEAIRATN